VGDDAQQDDDHRHEHEEVSPELLRREPVRVIGHGRGQVRREIVETADHQEQQAKPDDRRQGQETADRTL
jgi:hypothetical protein